MEQEKNQSQEQEKGQVQEEQLNKPTGNDFRPDKSELPKVELDESKLKKKWLVLAVLLLAFIGAIVVYLLVFNGNTDQQPPSPSDQASVSEQQQTDPDTIKILATGDWIAHDSVNEQAKSDHGYDYAQFTDAWKPYFEKSDINFCNLSTPAGGEQFGVSGYPVFNAPAAWNKDMNSLGCNLINTGTNHTNDKGQKVITAELDIWDELDTLAVAGANRNPEEQQEVRYFEVKGVKFAFVSYSTYTNITNPNPYSLNIFNADLYVPQMQEANENADIVIVSMRWGTEYSPNINTEQDNAAQTLANLGADIILGHGPHVLEPVKKLTGDQGNETYVWYSLGNFLNTQLETEALTGCVAVIEIDTPTKSVKSNKCLPFYMHYEWTAEQAAAEDLLTRTNLQIVPLDTSAELMAKSQLNTTVEQQTNRIMGIINEYIGVPLVESSKY